MCITNCTKVRSCTRVYLCIHRPRAHARVRVRGFAYVPVVYISNVIGCQATVRENTERQTYVYIDIYTTVLLLFCPLTRHLSARVYSRRQLSHAVGPKPEQCC